MLLYEATLNYILPICSFFANWTHYLGIAIAMLYQIYTNKITNSAESVFNHLPLVYILQKTLTFISSEKKKKRFSM